MKKWFIFVIGILIIWMMVWLFFGFSFFKEKTGEIMPVNFEIKDNKSGYEMKYELIYEGDRLMVKQTNIASIDGLAIESKYAVRENTIEDFEKLFYRYKLLTLSKRPTISLFSSSDNIKTLTFIYNSKTYKLSNQQLLPFMIRDKLFTFIEEYFSSLISRDF